MQNTVPKSPTPGLSTREGQITAATQCARRVQFALAMREARNFTGREVCGEHAPLRVGSQARPAPRPVHPV